MSDVPAKPERDEPPNRRVRFDPTVNLGHMITACTFLLSAGIAYASVQARLERGDEETKRVERQLIERIDQAERRWAADQQRDREAFVEIKLLLRDIDRKLDQKQDKPR